MLGIAHAAALPIAFPVAAARPLQAGDRLALDARSVRLLGTPLGSGATASGDPLRFGAGYCIGAGIARETPTTAIVFEWERDALVRLDPASGDRTLFAESAPAHASAGYVSAASLAVAPDGTIAVSSARAREGAVWERSIFEFDSTTAERRTRAEDAAIARSSDLAFAPGGALYAVGAPVSVAGGPVPFAYPFVSVDETGVVSRISGGELGAGPQLFAFPDSLALLPDGALVASMSGVALFRIDPITGAEEIAFDPRVGAGAVRAAWERLAVDGRGCVVVSSYDDLLRIDPAAGDRSVWSIGEGTDDPFRRGSCRSR